MSRWSRKKNCLFNTVAGEPVEEVHSRQLRVESKIQQHCVSSIYSYFLAYSLSCWYPETAQFCLLFYPGSAEDAIAVIKDGALAWRDGPLRGVEGDPRRGCAEWFDSRARGFVLVADFYLRANR